MNFFYKLIYSDVEDNVVVINDYDLQGFKYTNLLVGKPIQIWNSNICLFYEEDGQFEDYLPNPLGWPILSQRMVKLFDNLGVGNIQYLQINICHKASGKEVGGYQIANILELIPALDLKESVYHSQSDTTGRVEGLIKLVICSNKIGPDVHIFRLTEYPFALLISEKLKKVLVKEKITGIDFSRVKTL